MKKYIAPALEVIEIEEICTLNGVSDGPATIGLNQYEEGLEQQ